jgi:hypothetical protein
LCAVVRLIPDVMAVIRCAGTQLPWAVGYGFFAAYFLVILLYCVIPIIRQRAAFARLSLLSRAMRIAFAIALSMKTGTAIALIVIGNVAWASADAQAGLYGAFLGELPCYIITSCYSIVLIFWLSVCAQTLPMVYIGAFRWMKRILIVFNMLIYLLFVGIVIIALGIITPANRPTSFWIGAFAIGRDFLLAVIFIVFLITFRLGVKDDASAGDAIGEKKMVCFTVVLSVFLVLRGAVTLIQGLAFSESTSECSHIFLAFVIVNEVIFEGSPFVVLIRSNNTFLAQAEADSRSPLGDRLALPDVLAGRDL